MKEIKEQNTELGREKDNWKERYNNMKITKDSCRIQIDELQKGRKKELNSKEKQLAELKEKLKNMKVDACEIEALKADNSQHLNEIKRLRVALEEKNNMTDEDFSLIELNDCPPISHTKGINAQVEERVYEDDDTTEMIRKNKINNTHSD